MMILPPLIQSYSVIAILIVAMMLFITGKWRYDIVALFTLMLTIVIGAVPFSQVFSGLSNPAVITVACVMVISSAISRAGILDALIQKINQYAKTPLSHIITLSFLSALLSAFMNNIGALALMLPIAIQTAEKKQSVASTTVDAHCFWFCIGWPYNDYRHPAKFTCFSL